MTQTTIAPTGMVKSSDAPLLSTPVKIGIGVALVAISAIGIAYAQIKLAALKPLIGLVVANPIPTLIISLVVVGAILYAIIQATSSAAEEPTLEEGTTAATSNTKPEDGNSGVSDVDDADKKLKEAEALKRKKEEETSSKSKPNTSTTTNTTSTTSTSTATNTQSKTTSNKKDDTQVDDQLPFVNGLPDDEDDTVKKNAGNENTSSTDSSENKATRPFNSASSTMNASSSSSDVISVWNGNWNASEINQQALASMQQLMQQLMQESMRNHNVAAQIQSSFTILNLNGQPIFLSAVNLNSLEPAQLQIVEKFYQNQLNAANDSDQNGRALDDKKVDLSKLPIADSSSESSSTTIVKKEIPQGNIVYSILKNLGLFD